jgi:alginate O-acetyltransferase complex protein AlgI
MAIVSIQFLFFVLASLGIYYLLPRKIQNYWLLLVSYIFYITWAWEAALTLAILTLVTYSIGLALNSNTQKRYQLLWLGIGLNLFALVFFRLNDFFLPNLFLWLESAGINTQGGSLGFLIPIGLSFYVLQNISYLVDVYRKQLLPTNNLVDFALYLAYFPKLLAGPIERARTFLPKLEKPRVVDESLLARSLVLIVIGYLRKVVIADTFIAGTPSGILEQPYNYGALELAGWLLIYAFALYNDFAGYTSIVRGISGLFGIELSPNFNLPYLSRNFSEFWNRWHITLSQWLRDYIFFPLTRALMARIPNRQNLIVIALPPFVTMLASGFWHGLSWNMLFWGVLHGIYLTGERIISFKGSGHSSEQPRWRQGLGILITFALVTLAWVPFRLELPNAFHYWLGLLKWGNLEIVHWRELYVGLMYLVPVIILEGIQWRYQEEVFILRWPRLAQAFVLASIIFLIFIGFPFEVGPPFVYQGF